MKCPRCGSEEAHKTNLHECLNGGTPMKCSDCYHTWCEGEPKLKILWHTDSPLPPTGYTKVICPSCRHKFNPKQLIAGDFYVPTPIATVATDMTLPWLGEPILQPPTIICDSEKKWYEKHGRDKCKYGNQCTHCCPYCCTIYEYDEKGMVVGIKGMKFEQKEKEVER